ncbi:MAG: hypothetical protein ACRED3_16460, partial [Bradyrhizobium sp.]
MVDAKALDAPANASGEAMTLTEYLAGMRAASTAAELEAAIQVPFKHRFSGPTWSRISNVRIDTGNRICDAHPHGHLVPRFGPRRRLTIAGQTYGVAHGGNGAGARYAWYCAGEWAMQIMRDEGLSQVAAHRIWDCWAQYPHRCLPILDDAFAGKISDPQLDVLSEPYMSTAGPIRYT